jgi:hypothetical protein
VGILLAAIAALQLYGLQRNNRHRVTTEDRFTDLFAEIGTGKKEAGEGRKYLIDAIGEAKQEARDSFDALFNLFRAFSEKNQPWATVNPAAVQLSGISG